MFNFLQNSLNVSDVKCVPASEIIFLGSPNSANIILAGCTRTSANRPAIFGNWEFTVIIYNTKKIFIINNEYVSTNYLLGFLGYVIV